MTATLDTEGILVVDDDPDILESMCLVLEDAGYRVATAGNGAEALERLRRGAAPRLILLDLMMPVMDGWQFLAERARDPRLSAIPVIVISGAGKPAGKVMPLGAGGLLEKPVNLDKLLGMVELYC